MDFLNNLKGSKMNKATLEKEINRRRTFAIISHPDAGKTTLTEKFLLYGGAIREAGSVKSRRSAKHAVSDWMEIEKQRGISVTSSVLQFEYNGYCINILDTPGHQDFSEDTYRTLMAADCAVMVIDCAKGVEAQTEKLFHVCKMRGIPIFTFINKMDRIGKDPFELVENIEQVLSIKSYPMNWPIGDHNKFKGVYNRHKKSISIFSDMAHGSKKADVTNCDLQDNTLSEIVGKNCLEKIQEDIELLDIAGDSYDVNLIQKGELTPIFFGSALTNFGVEPFLQAFLDMTPPPTPRMSNQGLIKPTNEEFTGFIFKIQANMDKAHRDRIAFLRICSGHFEKGMQAIHVQNKKQIRLSQPQQFMAQDRVIVDTAFAGDIIGIHDTGTFSIGDSICATSNDLQYAGIPQFASEHFAKIYTKNALRRKQFIKGIEQLSQEGAIQVYKQPHIGVEELIIGVVGILQFEVLEYRLKNEYNVDVLRELLPYKYIRWIDPDTYNPDKFSKPSDAMIVQTKDNMPVILYQREWSLKHIEERNPNIKLSEVSFNKII